LKDYFVYILASRRNGALYIGVTNDLLRRIWEHRNELVDGFTKKYKIKQLVYYEISTCVEEAILYEKRIKKWSRDWKMRLIEKRNPNRIDLYDEIAGFPPSRE